MAEEISTMLKQMNYQSLNFMQKSEGTISSSDQVKYYYSTYSTLATCDSFLEVILRKISTLGCEVKFGRHH